MTTAADRLVDEVPAYAGAPVRSALEIGARAGKATRAFAARGIAGFDELQMIPYYAIAHERYNLYWRLV